MNISFVKWVTTARAAELIGLKICDLELRIRKHWKNGTHWRRTERGVEVNLLEADRWVEQSTYTREKRNHRNVERAAGAQSVVLQSASDIIARSGRISTKCGVYFLINDGRIVYVGKSINIAARIGQHASEKEFDSFAFILCGLDELDETERAYISAMKPPMNRAGVK